MPKLSTVRYLEDNGLLAQLVEQLWIGGYVPSFVHSMQRSDSTVTGNKIRLKHAPPYTLMGDPLPLSTYLAVANEHPYLGVGVTCPVTHDPRIRLAALDIDYDDDPSKGLNTQICVASVIQQAVPTRFGSKGCAMFVAVTDPDKAWYEARDLWQKDIVYRGFQGLKKPEFTGNSMECLLFSEMQHMVLPPSLWLPNTVKAGAFPAEPSYYRWVQFPSINPRQQLTLSLFTTPLAKLTRVTDMQMMEIILHVREPENYIAAFIAGDVWSGGDGAYRTRAMQAIDKFVREGFTDDYMMRRMLECATDHQSTPDADAAWGEDNDDFERDLKGMILGSRKKAHDMAPARGKNKPKQMPADRIVSEWLLDRYRRDDVAVFNGEQRWWTGSSWDSINHDKLGRMAADHHVGVSYSSIKDGVKMFVMQTNAEAPVSNPDVISFANGTLDLATGELRDHRRDDHVPHRMQVSYEPDRSCPNWVSYLTSMTRPPPDVCSDMTAAQIMADHKLAFNLIEEYLGYCMARSYQFQKMLFLIGKPGCGKGTLRRIAALIFPSDAMTGVSMDDFDDQTAIASMAGRLVNFGSEVGRRNSNVDQALLKVTSSEEVKMWIMHTVRAHTRLAVRLVFDGNLPPTTSDPTGAFKRRSLILRLSPRAEGPEINSDTMLDRYRPEAPAIAARWAEAYRKLRIRGEFAPPSYMEKENEELRTEASPVSLWLRDCVKFSDRVCPGEMLYKVFADWAVNNGFRPVPSVVTWGRILTEAGHPSRTFRIGPTFARGRNLEPLNPDEFRMSGVKY